MNARLLVAVAFGLVLSTTAGCAAQEDDGAEGSNEAISTPRDNPNDPDGKVADLGTALSKATAKEFGKDVGDGAKSYVDAVVTWIKNGLDPEAEAWSFKVKSDKYYIVEIRSSWASPLYYAYAAQFDGGYAGFFKSELAPKAFARCEQKSETLVRCTPVSDATRIYEPPASSNADAGVSSK